MSIDVTRYVNFCLVKNDGSNNWKVGYDLESDLVMYKTFGCYAAVALEAAPMAKTF